MIEIDRRTRPNARSGRVRRCFERDGVGVVPLAGGGEALIDLADLPEVSLWSWHLSCGGKKGALPYPARKIRRNGSSITQRLHQFLMPAKEGFVIDHIDRNRLNNQRANLRYASPSMNRRNTDASENVGLRHLRDQGRWAAVLRLGDFATKSEARAAYDEALRKVFADTKKAPSR